MHNRSDSTNANSESCRDCFICVYVIPKYKCMLPCNNKIVFLVPPLHGIEHTFLSVISIHNNVDLQMYPQFCFFFWSHFPIFKKPKDSFWIYTCLKLDSLLMQESWVIVSFFGLSILEDSLTLWSFLFIYQLQYLIKTCFPSYLISKCDALPFVINFDSSLIYPSQFKHWFPK